MGKIKAIKGLGKAFLEAATSKEMKKIPGGKFVSFPGEIVKTAKKQKKGVVIGVGGAAITDALLEAQNKKKDKKKSKEKND